MAKQRITYADGAINWMWYGQIDIDVEAGTAEFVKGSAYRLHRFDENQGAGKHPTTTWTLNGRYNGGGGPHKGYEAVSVTNRETNEQHVLSLLDSPIWARRIVDAFRDVSNAIRYLQDERCHELTYNGEKYDLDALRRSYAPSDAHHA